MPLFPISSVAPVLTLIDLAITVLVTRANAPGAITTVSRPEDGVMLLCHKLEEVQFPLPMKVAEHVLDVIVMVLETALVQGLVIVWTV